MSIRAVLIGFAHMHVNEIAMYIAEHPAYTLVGCADIPPEKPELTEARYTRAWNLKHVSETFSVPVFADYVQMLETVKPDIAFILTENFRKAEVAEQVAAHGVTVSIEKPMSVTLDEALKIRDAGKKYGVEVYVNWPVAWRPYMLELREFARSGMIGDVIKMYYINGHTGPLGKGARHRGVDTMAEEMTDEQRASTWWYKNKTGGGVYLDIGCYGCMNSTLFQKEDPISVYAWGANLATPYSETADNLMARIRYPHSYSLIEGTWTSPQALFGCGPIVTGTEGVLYTTRYEEGWHVRAKDLTGADIALPEIAFPDSMKNIAHNYAHHLETGEPVDEMITLEQNIRVMSLLDALQRSAWANAEVAVRNV